MSKQHEAMKNVWVYMKKNQVELSKMKNIFVTSKKNGLKGRLGTAEEKIGKQ